MPKSKRKPLSARAKYLDKIPASQLHAALGRRRYKRIKEQAPDLLAEREKKRIATAAIRAKFCTHSALEPKVMARGENIGLLCCRSCEVSLEEWVTWIPRARCRDPKHVGCKHEGRCWALQEPGKAVRRMPCPRCGGFEWEVVNASSDDAEIPDWMRLDAETASDAMSDIEAYAKGTAPHIDRALGKIKGILYALAKDNATLFPSQPWPTTPGMAK